ncbi:MAG: hypothetical protein IJI35_06010 [Kiritimatiellae bacterium]|nr:hypothetical protein [Kiritimatiellia bacterium]
MRNRMIPTAVLVAALACGAHAGDMLTYYPNGATATAPFSWAESANWFETNSYDKLPTVSVGRVPSSSDKVLIQEWGGISPATPVVIGSGSEVSVASLTVGYNKNNGKTHGYGASLTVDGGKLNVAGSMIFSSGNYTYGTFALKNGAEASVSGNAQFGNNNYTVNDHCRVDVDGTSSFNVAGTLSVGVRATKSAAIVTNRGTVVAGTLAIGPGATSNDGTGVVYNVGHLVVSNKLVVGGTGAKNMGRGELYLPEGSSLELGETAEVIAGSDDSGPIDGILDTEIPIVISAGQKIRIGNTAKSADDGGVLRLRGNARLDRFTSRHPTNSLEIGSYQYGRGRLQMFDDSSITNVTHFLLSDYKNTDSWIEMHDRATITNVASIRLAKTTGTRTGSRGHLVMDGNSAIYFNCPEEVNEASGFILGTTDNNVMEMVLRDNALITGFHRMNGAVKADGFRLSIRLEGGRIVFKPTSYNTRWCLNFGGSNNADDGVGVISGYGTMTRTDAANPSSSKYMLMSCAMHDFAFIADGCGAERDLDMRAFGQFNSSSMANVTGTNGWYAVNGGRLIYPRGGKSVGVYADSPAAQVGNFYKVGTNELGEVKTPTLVNSFSMQVTTSAGTGGKAWPYAALYAPDRTDYPANVLRGREGKVVAVWRIGTCTTGWNSDEPRTPWTNWTQMKLTFRYDATAFDGVTPVKLYRHEGVESGSWRLVSKQDVPAEDSLISATVAPGAGTWNVGWFALVEQPEQGTIILVK